MEESKNYKKEIDQIAIELEGIYQRNAIMAQIVYNEFSCEEGDKKFIAFTSFICALNDILKHSDDKRDNACSDMLEVGLREAERHGNEIEEKSKH